MIWICNVLAWVVPTLILQWPAIFRRETTPKQTTKALPSEQNLQNFVSWGGLLKKFYKLPQKWVLGSGSPCYEELVLGSIYAGLCRLK